MGLPDQPGGQDGQQFSQPQAPGTARGWTETGQRPGWQRPVARPPNNRLAVASLVAGLVGYLGWFALQPWYQLYLLGFGCAIVALILGIVALTQIRQRSEGGRGIAVAGIILGALGLLWPVLFVAFFAAVGGIGVPL